MERRLNIRFSEDDYAKLAELRDVLHVRTDSDTIRALVRIHHKAEQAAVKRMRRVRK